MRLGYNMLSIDSDVIVYDDPYKYLKAPPFNTFQVGTCTSRWVRVPQGPALQYIPGSWVGGLFIDALPSACCCHTGGQSQSPSGL